MIELLDFTGNKKKTRILETSLKIRRIKMNTQKIYVNMKMRRRIPKERT